MPLYLYTDWWMRGWRAATRKGIREFWVTASWMWVSGVPMAAQRANHTLWCIRPSAASWVEGGVISLSSAAASPPEENGGGEGGPASRGLEGEKNRNCGLIFFLSPYLPISQASLFETSCQIPLCVFPSLLPNLISLQSFGFKYAHIYMQLNAGFDFSPGKLEG